MTTPLGSFTPLSLEPTDRFFEHRRVFRLKEDLTYHSTKYGSITVPKGFETDLASVPLFFQLFVPVTGRYLEATIIHDYLYEHALRTKQEADAILAEGMRVLKGKRWRQIVINLGVKYFGKGRY